MKELAPTIIGADPPDAIALRRLCTTFGERVIHHDLALSVSMGEIVAIAGDNGSGKTTLLRQILGLHPASSGEIRLLGTSPPYSRAHLAKVGAMIGDSPVLPWMRAEAFLKMLLETAGEADRGRALHSLNAVGIPRGRLRTRLGKMSQGEVRLVGIAAATLRSPQVLILDEPYAHLDQSHVHKIEELIRSAAADGGSVLFTTHRTSEVLAADRLLVLSSGQLHETTLDSELACSVLR